MNRIKIRTFIPLLVILLVYFGLRFQNILSIPVFGDEAIYIRWSQLIKNVETLRFVPLSDGKQPLFMWFTAISLRFVNDPLLAGRLVSIIAGAGTISTIYIFCLLFLNPSVAILSSLCYLFFPFSFFFDRMALPDNLLSFFGTTSLLLSFALACTPRLDLALILGFSLGLAWLTKSPAIYFIALSLITFIFYNLKNLKKIYLPIVSAFLAFCIYNILRLGPQFSQIALRNQDYVWSPFELLKHPFDPLIPHLKDVFTIYSQYISLPIIICGLVGILLSRRHLLKHLKHWLLFLWWVSPLITNALIAKVFTARYILFTLPPLIILISVGLFYLLRQTKAYFHSVFFQAVALLILFSLNLFWIYHISFNPFNTTLPSTEIGYLTDWTSGWGIKDASIIFIDQSKNHNLIVGTEGYFGTLPDGLQIYTDQVKQLTVIGVGVDINKISPQLIDARQHGDEVYLLLNHSRNHLPPESLDKLQLLKQFPKPKSDFLDLYRLN